MKTNFAIELINKQIERIQNTLESHNQDIEECELNLARSKDGLARDTSNLADLIYAAKLLENTNA